MNNFQNVIKMYIYCLKVIHVAHRLRNEQLTFYLIQKSKEVVLLTN
jgi:hypothetical protein